MRKFRKYTATALVAMMVAGMTMSGYQPADVSASQESEYIIVTKDKKSMKTVESKYNTMIDTQEQNTDFLKDENVLVSKMTAKEADIVNKDQKVVSVEKNTMVNASETESTTAAKEDQGTDSQWNLKSIHVDKAKDTATDEKVKVALLDSGIDYQEGLNVKPIIVGPGIKTGINLGRFNPREVGADRIVDLVAGYEIYGGPALVIDYGTATTYDIVTENGVFLAGVIAPGIRTSANVLYRDAARLPEIEILKPKTILANSTIDSMQAGLYYGVVGETKYMVQKMREETGFDNMKVIATGGLGNMIAQTVDEIDYYDPTLTLKGLQIIYEKQ